MDIEAIRKEVTVLVTDGDIVHAELSAEETTVKPMEPVPSPSESETGEGDEINIQEKGCRSIISVARSFISSERISEVTCALALLYFA